jgi:type III secretion system FlhB-like substrate exporter
VLQLDYADAVPADLYEAIAESVAFVNRRRLEAGEPAVSTLVFSRT